MLADLADDDKPIDNVTVRHALSNRSLLDKAGGAAYLIDLAESTAGASNVAAYARIVRERATLGRLLAAANGIAASTLDPEGRDTEAVIDEAEREVFATRDGRPAENAPQRVEELVVGVKERLECPEELAALFKPQGRVERVNIPADRETGRQRARRHRATAMPPLTNRWSTTILRLHHGRNS